MSPSEIDIRRIDRTEDPVLRNLFELYLHDMAEWFAFDTEADGRYAHDLDEYWSQGAEAFLVRSGAIPIGFAIVGSAEPYVGDPRVRDLDEFFVVRRHRRTGVGRVLAAHVFDAYPGPWLVRVFRGNAPAVPFWRGVIREYSGGRFTEEMRAVGERAWSYFRFERGA